MLNSVPRIGRILARNTLSSWINHAVVVANNLIMTPIIIKYIGGPGYGVWILLSQITGYAGLLDVGFQPAMVKYAASALAKGDQRQLRQLVSTAMAIQISLSFIALVSFFAIKNRLVFWFDLGSMDASTVEHTFLLFGIGIALGLPATVFSAVLKGYQRHDLVAWISILVQIVRSAGMVIALVLGKGIVGLAVAALISNTIGYVSSFFFMVKISPSSIPSFHFFSWAITRSLFSFGVFSVIGSFGLYLSNASDALVIGVFLTSLEIAYFGIAIKILALLSGIIHAFTATFLPLASEFKTNQSFEKIRELYLFGTRVSLFIASPLALVLILWGKEIISLWVGEEFGVEAGLILQVLTIAHLAIIANAPTIQIALGTGLHRTLAFLTLADGAINIVVSCILVKLFGLLGVALGTLISSLFIHSFIWPLYIQKKLDLDLKKYWNEALKPVVPVVTLLPVLLAMDYFVTRTFPILLIALIPAFLLSYWAFIIHRHLPYLPLRTFLRVNR